MSGSTIPENRGGHFIYTEVGCGPAINLVYSTHPALQYFVYAEQLTGYTLNEKWKWCLCISKLSYTTRTRFTNEGNLLLAVSQLAIFTHGHWFLLDVILREQTRLAGHHLHDGSWDHHVLDSVVGLPRLPSLWRNHLRKDNIYRLVFYCKLQNAYSQIFKLASTLDIWYIWVGSCYCHLCQASPVSSLTLHVDNVSGKIFELFYSGPERHDLAAGVFGAEWRLWKSCRG